MGNCLKDTILKMEIYNLNIIRSGQTKRAFFSHILILPFLPVFVAALISFQPVSVAEDALLYYSTRLNGIEDKELLSYFKAYSDLIRLKERPPASLTLLKKRADNDKEKIIKFLKAKGFFKGEAVIDIDKTKIPVELNVKVKPGPRFTLKGIRVESSSDSDPATVNIDSSKTGLLPGTSYRSDLIAEGREKLINFLKKQGFPFAGIVDQDITADHLDNSVSVIYLIDSGPKAVFGDTVINGIESVDQSYILNKIMWKRGDPYNIDLIEKTHAKLTGLGLFTIVRIVEGKSLEDDGRLRVTIDLKERKHKTVGAGVFYSTDEGPGLKFLWENRNLMGRGEKFSANIEFSDFTVATEETFRKPDFYREDQNIRVSFRLAEDTPDAFKSSYMETAAIIDRKLSENLDIGGGIAYKSSTVEQLNTENNFSLFSIPLFYLRDNTDDLLDPRKGSRISVEITPFYDTSGSGSIFTRGLVGLRYYKGLPKIPSVNLAANLTMGSIYGAPNFEIPADERFYAGGGGSVRGYPYQSIGPYSEGQPVGGRSLLEFSIEPRVRLSNKLGLAFFVDGGTSFEDQFFSSKEDILWGAGVGMRYYTAIGPLRFDVAFPMNRRPGIDDPFQIYISIGQAF